MQGGDLRFYLNTKGEMSEDMARYYTAEILLALEELHSKKILYRDLKPDNCLLDEQGHVSLSDFGLAVFLKKESHFMTLGTAGTYGYQAPEVHKRVSYGPGVDVWSFGVLLYELLHRQRPFRNRSLPAKPDDDPPIKKISVESPSGSHRQLIVTDEPRKDILIMPDEDYRLKFHITISPEARDLLKKLLRVHDDERLGYLEDGYDLNTGIGPGWDWSVIKRHPFFQAINWNALAQKKIPPPYVPKANRVHCNLEFELRDEMLGPDEITAQDKLTLEEQKIFEGYEWNTNLRNMEKKQIKNSTSTSALFQRSSMTTTATTPTPTHTPSFAPSSVSTQPNVIHLKPIVTASTRTSIVSATTKPTTLDTASARTSIASTNTQTPYHSPISSLIFDHDRIGDSPFLNGPTPTPSHLTKGKFFEQPPVPHFLSSPESTPDHSPIPSLNQLLQKEISKDNSKEKESSKDVSKERDISETRTLTSSSKNVSGVRKSSTDDGRLNVYVV